MIGLRGNVLVGGLGSCGRMMREDKDKCVGFWNEKYGLLLLLEPWGYYIGHLFIEDCIYIKILGKSDPSIHPSYQTSTFVHALAFPITQSRQRAQSFRE